MAAQTASPPPESRPNGAHAAGSGKARGADVDWRWQKPAFARVPEEGWPPYHDMVARVAALERAPVFFALRESSIRALARRLRRVTVAAGEMIIYQGEPGDSLFFIEQGRCRVVIEKPPAVVTVAVLSEGDFFGESACVLNRPQQASIYAQTDCSLLTLDRKSLGAVLGGRDAHVLDALRALADQRYTGFADGALLSTWAIHHREATIVGVYSPKGGAGGTCLSLNLVGALARRYPGEVLLLDLDFPYAHSALLAGLVPTSCLARLGGVPDDVFDEVLLSAVLYHPRGPMILPGALKPEEADAVTPELITRALAVLRRSFRYIVVDLGVTINDSTLALLDLTQHILLVAGAELSSVKSAADAMVILAQLGMPTDAVSIVLNNRSPKPAVSRAALARMLERGIDVEVAFDGIRPDKAAVAGQILSLTDPRSEITKGVEAIAMRLEARSGAHYSRRTGRQAAEPAVAAGDRGIDE
jgi:Flp pilus assembly CpaE family ATPase